MGNILKSLAIGFVLTILVGIGTLAIAGMVKIFNDLTGGGVYWGVFASLWLGFSVVLALTSSVFPKEDP